MRLDETEVALLVATSADSNLTDPTYWTSGRRGVLTMGAGRRQPEWRSFTAGTLPSVVPGVRRHGALRLRSAGRPALALRLIRRRPGFDSLGLLAGIGAVVAHGEPQP
jgi:hypothetical protein